MQTTVKSVVALAAAVMPRSPPRRKAGPAGRHPRHRRPPRGPATAHRAGHRARPPDALPGARAAPWQPARGRARSRNWALARPPRHAVRAPQPDGDARPQRRAHRRAAPRRPPRRLTPRPRAATPAATRAAKAASAAPRLQPLPRYSRRCSNHSPGSRAMVCRQLAAAAALATVAAAAAAQDTPVAIGISGWTGFAPLTLAKEAGLFKKHGLDVSIKKIPQKDRHLGDRLRRRPVRGDDGRRRGSAGTPAASRRRRSSSSTRATAPTAWS